MAELQSNGLDPAPDSVTAKLVPDVMALLDGEKAALKAAVAIHYFDAWVFEKAWAFTLRVVPKIVGYAVERIRDRYGHVTLNDALDAWASGDGPIPKPPG